MFNEISNHMKTIYLILCLLILPFILNAQVPGIDAVVAPVKMNVMYLGMANPIEIAVPGITSDKITATVSNGTIKKVANGWEVLPGDTRECIVSVLVDNKKVSDKKFRVKLVPNPVAIFAGKYDGRIAKDIALKTEALDAELINFDWDLKFTIKSFTFFSSDGKNDYEEVSDGNKLTEKMKSLITNCKTGQNIVFKNIVAVGPDGKTRNLNPVIIVLE
jgi:gliding motility-associated protein GldM